MRSRRKPPNTTAPIPPSACLLPPARKGGHRERRQLDGGHQRDVLAFTEWQIEESGQHVRRLLPPLLLEVEPPAPAQLCTDGIDDLLWRGVVGQAQADHAPQLLLVVLAKGGAEHRVDGVVDLVLGVKARLVMSLVLIPRVACEPPARAGSFGTT